MAKTRCLPVPERNKMQSPEVMKIDIEMPHALNEKGRRSNNQDSIFPAAGEESADHRVFLVCDGVGGAVDGATASRIVADGFGELLQRTTTADSLQIADILQSIQNQIDDYLLEHPESRGMATTMTLLHLHTKGATIAHIGDSRVYHIRGNDILFCTEDHSLVNELKKRGYGEIDDSKSNIITRAVQGSSTRSVQADVTMLHDILPGDYFLLCSDGVWGVIPDNDLIEILRADTTDGDKIEHIRRICEKVSKDNYSAYLIRIREVSASEVMNPEPVALTRSVLVEDTSKPWRMKWLIWMLLFMLAAWLLFRMFIRSEN